MQEGQCEREEDEANVVCKPNVTEKEDSSEDFFSFKPFRSNHPTVKAIVVCSGLPSHRYSTQRYGTIYISR